MCTWDARGPRSGYAAKPPGRVGGPADADRSRFSAPVGEGTVPGLVCTPLTAYGSRVNATQVADVVRIATEVGVPAELFEGWQGHELALYQDTVGRSASLEVARREAE